MINFLQDLLFNNITNLRTKVTKGTKGNINYYFLKTYIFMLFENLKLRENERKGAPVAYTLILINDNALNYIYQKKKFKDFILKMSLKFLNILFKLRVKNYFNII